MQFQAPLPHTLTRAYSGKEVLTREYQKIERVKGKTKTEAESMPARAGEWVRVFIKGRNKQEAKIAAGNAITYAWRDSLMVAKRKRYIKKAKQTS